MRVLVACEESQIVTMAFRGYGHEAYSCDLYECSGGHPEWHYKCDIRELLPGSWDLIIAHPPCTFLCKAQLWRCVPGTKRYQHKEEAINFVKFIYNQPCPLIAIENPIGCLSREWRKWDQLIYPWQFGDPYRKDICLWLKGLHKLKLGEESSGRKSVSNNVNGRMSQAVKSRIKSKFFPGIAAAMAEQWGNIES
jgi:hypothetical protein